MRRLGLDWELEPREFLQWELYYGFRDDLLALLTRIASVSRVVCDVGAYVGVYSIVFSKLVGPHGRVYSFEPNPRSFQRLLEHRRLNNATNVECFSIGLSNAIGVSRLRVSTDGAFLSTLREKGGDGVAVTVSTLDDFAKRAGVGRVDLLKIDVEGHEPEVLLGSRALLSSSRPVLCFEFTPAWYRGRESRVGEVIQMLRHLGYAMWAARAGRLVRFDPDVGVDESQHDIVAIVGDPPPTLSDCFA